MGSKARYLQLFFDALIPLAGFFWWDWSLYFIILFYLLDMLANEIVQNVKANRIRKEQKRSIWLGYGSLSLILFLFIIIFSHIGIFFLHTEISFTREILAFWKYKDMGFEQGYLLIPLIALINYQRYKLEFLLPKLFNRTSMKELWLEHIKALIIICVLTLVGAVISFFVILPEVFYLFGIIILSSVYQILKLKKKT